MRKTLRVSPSNLLQSPHYSSNSFKPGSIKVRPAKCWKFVYLHVCVEVKNVELGPKNYVKEFWKNRKERFCTRKKNFWKIQIVSQKYLKDFQFFRQWIVFSYIGNLVISELDGHTSNLVPTATRGRRKIFFKKIDFLKPCSRGEVGYTPSVFLTQAD